MRLLMLGSGSYKSSLTHFRLIALAKELSKLGNDVHVIVPSADKYNNYTPDKTARVEGITLVQPWQPATKNDFVNLIPYLLTASFASIRVKPKLICLTNQRPSPYLV